MLTAESLCGRRRAAYTAAQRRCRQLRKAYEELLLQSAGDLPEEDMQFGDRLAAFLQERERIRQAEARYLEVPHMQALIPMSWPLLSQIPFRRRVCASLSGTVHAYS
jgi:hypothetical protein